MNLAARQPSPLVTAATRAPVVIRSIELSGRWRGTTVAVAWLRYLAGELVWRARRRADPRARGRRLRDLLESLGGLWIKVGQLLSLRVDLFDPAWCEELAALQDRAYGFPGELARQRIEEDLGIRVDDLFDDFELHPIAAASIGQVHRARLRDGRTVAIKVRRPFIEAALSRELALLARLLGLLDRLRLAPFMKWRHMRWELETMLREELDYRSEASSMERLRASLRGRGMYVPMVYRELSSSRVLTMEFVSGVLLSDYIAARRADPATVRAWEVENGIDPRRLVRRFSHGIMRQILEDNLYHGDLHPGNIVLLRDNRVALLDYGAVGFTEREYLDRLRLFMHAMTCDEFGRGADLGLLLAGALPNTDLEPVRAEVVRELHAWRLRTGVRSLPYRLKAADAVNVAIAQIFVKYRITFEWAFFRIRRALATLDATVMHLDPDADHTRLMRAYFAQAASRAVGARKARRGLVAGGGDAFRRFGEATDLALAIERRRLRIAQATVSATTRVILVAARFTMWLSGAGAAAAIVSMSAQHGPSWLAAAAGLVSAGLVDLAPRLDWQIWLAACVVGLVTARTAAGLRSNFRAVA
jgi:ubiquinone biosynthesis protein